MKESAVEKLLVEMGRARGFWVPKTEMITPGFPDRTLFGRGPLWFVETKAPDGVLSERQIEIHKLLASFGKTAYVLWTKQQVRDFYHVVDKT